MGYWSDSDFGTSSPRMTWAAVSTSSTSAAAVDWAASVSSPPAAASHGASQTAKVACAYAPSTRLDSVMPIWQAAM